MKRKYSGPLTQEDTSFKNNPPDEVSDAAENRRKKLPCLLCGDAHYSLGGNEGNESECEDADGTSTFPRETIGAGVFGSVSRAREDRSVVKRLHDTTQGKGHTGITTAADCLQEARQAAKFYDGLPTVHVFSDNDTNHRLVLPYIPGEELRVFFDKNLSWSSVSYKVLLGLLQRVAKLADNSMTHGDLHSGNIRVTTKGEVEIIDFGMAKAAKHQEKHLVRIVSRPDYWLAPWRIQGTTTEYYSCGFAEDRFSMIAHILRYLIGLITAGIIHFYSVEIASAGCSFSFREQGRQTQCKENNERPYQLWLFVVRDALRKKAEKEKEKETEKETEKEKEKEKEKGKEELNPKTLTPEEAKEACTALNNINNKIVHLEVGFWAELFKELFKKNLSDFEGRKDYPLIKKLFERVEELFGKQGLKVIQFFAEAYCARRSENVRSAEECMEQLKKIKPPEMTNAKDPEQATFKPAESKSNVGGNPSDAEGEPASGKGKKGRNQEGSLGRNRQSMFGRKNPPPRGVSQEPNSRVLFSPRRRLR